MMPKTKATITPIQRGLVTHHQDQSITLQSFKPINKTVNKLKNILKYPLFVPQMALREATRERMENAKPKT